LYYYGTMNISFNGLKRNDITPLYSVNITQPSVINCSLGYDKYTFMNLKWFNEENKSSIYSNAKAAFYINYNDVYSKEFNFDIKNETEYDICIYPSWASVEYNSTILYDSSGYNTREYLQELQNADNSSIINIKLYNLPDTGVHSSDLLRLNLKDENDNNIEGAIFVLLRYYPNDGTEEYAAMARTDSSGNAFTYIEYDTAYYRIIVIYHGRVIGSFDTQRFDPTKIGEIINYKITSGEGLEYFNFRNLYYSYEINDTDVMTFRIVDVNNAGMAGGSLLVENMTMSGYSTVCDLTKSGSNAIVFYCPLGNYSGKIYKVSATVVSSLGKTYTVYNAILDYRNLENTYGNDGLLYAMVIHILFGTMSIPIGGYISVIISQMLAFILTTQLNLLHLEIGTLIMVEAFLAVVLVLLFRRSR